MYLVVNCKTKDFWQQKEISLEDPLRDDPDLLIFSARQIPLKANSPLEMCFEVTADSLTGWDEIDIKGPY